MITVGGMNIGTIDPEMLLSLYSIVFQDVMLFNNTIMENIRIGAFRRRASETFHCKSISKKCPDPAAG